MNIKKDLNKQQTEAVYHYKGPALVLAGPGSGKTRVITYRAAYLVMNHRISPESILAVTFTNKAAEEMKNRLRSDNLLGITTGMDVWIHTFHAFCARILREFGDRIGLNNNFAVIDQDSQEEIIANCIRGFGSSISENQVWFIRDFISEAKVKLKEPLEFQESERLKQYMSEENAIVTMDDLMDVVKRYQDYLTRHGALDFDDLVVNTVKLLKECNDVRFELQKKFQFLMVDEYQDINLSQYELIHNLCNSEENIMVVADDDQSIYSWRGSDPSFIDRFRDEYNPKVIQLIEHFRSTDNLLKASQSLIRKNTRRKKDALITYNDKGSKIYHYKMDTVNEEMRLVLWLINKLIHERHFSPSQIAIFYRTHRLADRLEQYLLENKIPTRRIRRESFFRDDVARGLIGYLRFICWKLTPDVKKAINFPEPVMDELTKLQIERAARKKGMEFFDFLKRIDEYQDVGPLTKYRIKRFTAFIDNFKANLKDELPSSIVRRLLDLLELERSPYRSRDLLAIQNPASSGGFWRAVNAIYSSVQQGQNISIIAEYGIDYYSAAGIIMHALQKYLNLGDRVKCSFVPQTGWSQPKLEKDVLYIVIGMPEGVPENIIEHSILIGADIDEKNIPCILALPAGPGGVVSTTALKLCQRLLSLYESGNTEGIVIYDLETISNDPKTAEIIEISAKKLGVRGKEGKFYTLIKPKRPIPKSSTDIHGIRNEDVEGQPGIEEVLGPFLDFIEDNILVGHNIVEFDNKIISKYIVEYLEKPELQNGSYDTLYVAKRLYPLENYKLEILADKFGISHGDLHRAEADAELTEKLFRELRREDLRRTERKGLPEVLPLVAIGILEKNAAMDQENAAFYNAALRYMRNRDEIHGTVELDPIMNLDASETEEAIRFLDGMKKIEAPDTKDDMDWNSIKAKFQNIVLDFEHSSYDKSISSFLNYSALLTNVDISDDKEDKVTMMTVHSAKGMEFPVVIMIGMEQGNFPISRPSQSENELEEERRLCYVGMTRAEKLLYLTSVSLRTNDREMTPSQFIWEVNPEFIKTIDAEQVRRGWEKERSKRQMLVTDKNINTE